MGRCWFFGVLAVVGYAYLLGPGCSSIGGGAFSELGPFYPRASNLLFVESPVGVGWSYSNTTSDYKTGDVSTSNDMLVFLLKWYEKFSSFKSRKLFLTGESYAGHYIPQLADAILNYNAKSTGFKFNIKGLAIGNPLLKVGSNERSRYDYYWSHGLISDELGLTIKKECKFEDDASANVSNSCYDAMSKASKSVGDYINEYDVILDVCYPAIAQQGLRLHKMKALHANRTNLPYKWMTCSDGDQDAVVPLLGTRTLIRELAQELNFNITVPYGAWFHSGQVGGWAIEYGNILTFATVRGAGHMVPYAQSSRALHLFSDFVLGRRLPNATRPSID
ncbi:unnamed protein product [Lupinus luteus]|uniref:Carboxypeptidase n=1 Tax=Lupinus luteus TaxID=3873 RepID=A0AAV1XEX2_LUPLU